MIIYCNELFFSTKIITHPNTSPMIIPSHREIALKIKSSKP